MSRKKKKSKDVFFSLKEEFNHEIYGIFTIALGLILLTALQSNGAGKVGEGLKYLLMGLFSNTAFILPYIMVLLGVLVFINKPFWKELKGKLFFILTFLCLLIFRTLLEISLIEELTDSSFIEAIKIMFTKGTQGIGGGAVGTVITYWLVNLFGQVGTYIIIVTLSLISIIIYTKISLLAFTIQVKDYIGNFFSGIKQLVWRFKVTPQNRTKKLKDKEIILEDRLPKTETNVEEKIKILDYTVMNKEDMKENVSLEKDETPPPLLEVEAYAENFQYEIPSIDLLDEINHLPNKDDKRKIVSKAKTLEETLKNFGVQAKVLQVSKGPAITRYELQPSTGVKVSKIVNLSDDIALNLAAPAIRIEAPIPGKAAIGIEIPNEDVTIVTLREIIDSEAYQSFSSSLPFALGKDISGSPFITDIGKMPHLLIAGATGSGKSVCINTLILSLLYKSTPDEVRLLMVDPKVVELNHYNGIPHLLIPVVTDAKKATSALNWAVQEMTQRYKTFSENSVKDIAGYNKKFQENKIPYIIIIIDELADLMLVAPNEVEDSICRLAQMARAAGIHLIIATQRPSVDVITGVIKANIPSRIAFSVASQTDSRTILDMGGAEKLLGKGDMLFYPIGASKPMRIQGAFVSEKEVEEVVAFMKEQVERPSYEAEIIEKIDQSNVAQEDMDSDELFEDALKIVVQSQQASISMLQRRLKIGYNRAARLIDEMEAKGMVGPHEGSKPRQVLVDKETFLQEGSC
ncbi:FtsK/SpoIIIE family DNA translocase [Clostridium formicaceticum]|uniref:Cell division protein FtsK n=1 Tax=Clostridium formicaceticum TaxID=1497 RepID=A0ABM6EZC3_9CLOT|nr:DNA translocase FtsK [Clostridium formicaceticum]AOY78420.1 cell division protein FtsK [Clostridium formicaceticum]